jgi:hypothetical protein
VRAIPATRRIARRFGARGDDRVRTRIRQPRCQFNESDRARVAEWCAWAERHLERADPTIDPSRTHTRNRRRCAYVASAGGTAGLDDLRLMVDASMAHAGAPISVESRRPNPGSVMSVRKEVEEFVKWINELSAHDTAPETGTLPPAEWSKLRTNLEHASERLGNARGMLDESKAPAELIELAGDLRSQTLYLARRAHALSQRAPDPESKPDQAKYPAATTAAALAAKMRHDRNARFAASKACVDREAKEAAARRQAADSQKHKAKAHEDHATRHETPIETLVASVERTVNDTLEKFEPLKHPDDPTRAFTRALEAHGQMLLSLGQRCLLWEEGRAASQCCNEVRRRRIGRAG